MPAYTSRSVHPILNRARAAAGCNRGPDGIRRLLVCRSADSFFHRCYAAAIGRHLWGVTVDAKETENPVRALCLSANLSIDMHFPVGLRNVEMKFNFLLAFI